MCGNMPSSHPVTNTIGNSRPFAVCNVIIVTTPDPSSGDAVRVGHQRHALQELGQHAGVGHVLVLKLGILLAQRRGVGRVDAVFVCDADQFVEVVKPRQILGITRRLELAAVSGAFEDGLDQVAQLVAE